MWARAVEAGLNLTIVDGAALNEQLVRDGLANRSILDGSHGAASAAAHGEVVLRVRRRWPRCRRVSHAVISML